jgi:hypothetical protein
MTPEIEKILTEGQDSIENMSIEVPDGCPDIARLQAVLDLARVFVDGKLFLGEEVKDPYGGYTRRISEDDARWLSERFRHYMKSVDTSELVKYIVSAPGRSFINWTAVDVENLPTEEVLAISSMGGITNGFLKDTMYSESGIGCYERESAGHWVCNLVKVTHYVLLSGLNRPNVPPSNEK